jgi:ribosome-binding protein aMBF1 (putative translation factor)
MAECEVCGNEYDKTFEVVAAGVHHTFDSFECAIHLMAPVCEHCGCKVVGHGTEVAGRFYCCAHCAKAAEHTDAVVDRIDTLV